MVARAHMSASGTLCGDIVPSIEVYVCPDCCAPYYALNIGVEASEDYPQKERCHPTIDDTLAKQMDGMKYAEMVNLCMYGEKH